MKLPLPKMVPISPDTSNVGPVVIERAALTKAGAGYRFAVVFGSIIGVVGFIACAIVGEFKIGTFLCIGLALGYLNTSMVVSATAKFAGSVDHDKRKFMGGVFTRLMTITFIAGLIVFAYRPQGLAVLFGLAFFQFTVIGSSAGILYREGHNS